VRRFFAIGSGALALLALSVLVRALPVLVLPVSVYLAFELRQKGARRFLDSLPGLLWRSAAFSALLVVGGRTSPTLVPSLAILFIGMGVFFSIAVLLSGDSLRQSLLLFAFCALYLPAGLACVYVPIRSVSLLLDSFLPAWAAGTSGVVPEGELPLVDWSDRLAAMVTLGLVGFFYFRERRWLDLQRRQLENLATSRPSSVALGLVEVVGRASAAGEPVRDGVLMTESDPRPFHVEDDRGRILVDPRRRRDDSVSLARFLGLELTDVSLSGGELVAGDTVYVVGTASVRDAEIVVHPRRDPKASKSATPSFVSEIATWFRGPEKSASDYLDAFFVSDRGESAAALSLQRRKRRVMAVGLTIVALSSVMALTRHFRLRPPEIVFEEAVFSRTGFPDSVHETILFLRHPHPDYRIAGARRLKETHPEVLDEETALELLKSAFPEAREVAAHCLGSASFDASDRPFFGPAAARFDENGPRTQALVLRALGPLGFDAEEAVPLIAKGVESALHDVRTAAVEGASAFVVPELAPKLAPSLYWWGEQEAGISFREEKGLIERAEETLVALGPASTDPLNRMLGSDDVVAEHVSEVFVRAAPDANELLSRLGKLLEDPRAPIRLGALRGFAKHSEASAESTRRAFQNRIRRHLHDEDRWVANRALEALEKAGAETLDEEDVRVVLSFLGESYYPRTSALRVLESAPVESAEVVDALVGYYRSSTDRYLRAFALENLTSFPPVPDSVVPLLVEGLSNDDSLLQVAATKAAAKLDRGSPELVRAATEAANVQDSGAYVAIELLGQWREWDVLLTLYREGSYSAAFDELVERAASDPSALPAALALLESPRIGDTDRILRAAAANGSEARPYLEQIRTYLRGIERKSSTSLYTDVLSAVEAPPFRERPPRTVYDAESGTLDREIPLPDGYTLTLWVRASERVSERVLACDLLTLWVGREGLTITFTLDPMPAESYAQVTARLPRILWDGEWHRIDVSHDAWARKLEVFFDGESRESFPSYEFGGLTPHPDGGEDVVVRRTPTTLTFVERGPSASAKDLVILDGPIR
jgi:hypothetical protein